MIDIARVAVDRTDDTLVVRLSGEIDMSNTERLESAVLAETVSADALVLDISGVTYLDSTGAALLLRLSTAFQERHVPHSFVAPREALYRRVLELLGLTTLLPIAESEEEALRRVRVR